MPLFVSKYDQTKSYDRPLFSAPASTEEIFSVKSAISDGVFELANDRFSKTFVLSDVNFMGITDSEQKEIIINFSHILNSISCRFSLTMANEHIDEEEFISHMYYRKEHDRYDWLREAFNEVIRDKVFSSKQGLYGNIYITLTINSKSVDYARVKFISIENTLRNAFNQIGLNHIEGSHLRPLSIDERMQMIYNFFHFGLIDDIKIDYMNELKNGKDWLSLVAPQYIEFYNEYFVLNNSKYGQALYIYDYPKKLKSEMIDKIKKSISCMYYISINSEVLDTNVIQRETDRKYNIVGYKVERQRDNNRKNNNFLADASPELLKQQDKLDIIDEEIKSGEDQFFNTSILILFVADSKVEMEQVYDQIDSEVSIIGCKVKPCFNMQREAINSILPFGLQEFKNVCNFNSKSQAMFMPFNAQEINHENGVWHGVNQLSQNAIKVDRKSLQNYNGLITGISGSGKSMFCKQQMLSVFLTNTKDVFFIIDPLSEFGDICDTLNGARISFDTNKELFCNPYDVSFKDVDYAGLQEIISNKVEFTISLLSCLMKRDLTPEEEGILDEAIDKVFSVNYVQRCRMNGIAESDTEFMPPEYMKQAKSVQLDSSMILSDEEQVRQFSPLLHDVYQYLVDSNNPVAHKLAGNMAIFVKGSLNIFNHHTNVDMKNRFTVFDFSKLKERLRPAAALVMIEIINTRMMENANNDIWTWLYIDEFHEFLRINSMAEHMVTLWKTVRHHKGIITGITQNMSEFVSSRGSEEADAVNLSHIKQIFGNTIYFGLLNQAPNDMDILLRYLTSVSPAMFSYVDGAAKGTGLLVIENSTIPFDTRMSKESRLYKLINTTEGNDGII